MAFKVIAVGKQREKGLFLAADEYLRRLTRYTKLTMIEVADEKDVESSNEKLQQKAKRAESERITAQLKQTDIVIVLDILGQTMDSETFSQKVLSWHEQANTVSFVIGGSLGLDDSLLKRADERLSLSAMTFPHQLARVMLLEQLYRSFKIIKGERYHK